jgi:DNA-binding SARP family transcriptional activator
MGQPGESATLRLEVLGGLRASLGEHPLTGLRTRKAGALLVYLTVTGRPQPREALAGLLCGGVPDAFARGSLRQTLANLRHLMGAHLETTPTAAAVRPVGVWTDAAAFEALLAERAPGAGEDISGATGLGRLRAAVALYGGDFLAGTAVPDAPAFDEWAAAERVPGPRSLGGARGAARRGYPGAAPALAGCPC